MHLRRLIVLIINARNVNDCTRSCLRVQSLSSGRCILSQASLLGFDRSDQKNQNSRTSTVPPRGCRVKQTVLYLFTMSKDPVTETSRLQRNQTLLLSHTLMYLAESAGNLGPSPFQTKFGGARRDRTDDILLAKQALSQLSYGPIMGATN